jgi:hypothetical protein
MESFNVWTTSRFVIDIFTGNGESRFWDFALQISNAPLVTGDAETVLIDSIFIYEVSAEFGVVQASTQVVPGLVPKADSTADSGKYLKSDGTWDDPPGGAASNSFETHTVTDTDSGFSWSETGSAIADSGADTLTWVSGAGIDIDVDASLDAIRISNTFTLPSGSTTSSILRWNGSAWVEEPGFRVNSAGVISIFNSALTEEVSITHDNTWLVFQEVVGANSGIDMRDGMSVRVRDSTDNAIFQMWTSLTEAKLETNIGNGIELRPNNVLVATFQTTSVEFELPLMILERAIDVAMFAGYGQFWVRNDTPNNPGFTDDSNETFMFTLMELGSGGVTGAATISRAWMHQTMRITSGTGNITFPNDSNIPIGAVGWIKNLSGNTRQLTQSSTTIQRFTGSAVTTGNYNLPNGAWIVWHKVAATTYEVTAPT